MNMAEVYLNGKFVGSVSDAKSFAQSLRDQRRSGQISDNINVHFAKELDAIYVESERGRVRRPLIVVKNGMPLLTDKHLKGLQKKEITWKQLVAEGVIEYLDAGEEEDALIGFTEEELTPQHTHLEVSALSMLGLVTALVPFSNFVGAARVLIGAKNQKQSIGMYASNFLIRMDMDVSILHTPQMPIVQSIMHEIGNYDRYAAGQNMVVAIMSYRGYNMEDALVVNKGSIERGLARSTYFRPAISEELRYSGGLTDLIGVPDKEVKGYKSEKDYRLLEDDGIIYPEAEIQEDDVIIGKTSPPRFLSGMEEYSLVTTARRESSITCRHGEQGIVDTVILTENEEGNKLVQVRVRDQRIPEVGDKFTSRHSQKGVIGLVLPEQDMPFSASGVRPDLLFSPHGIPGRMTVSHLLELLGGKVGSLAGRFVNGTTFDSESEDSMRKELLSLGFRDNGVETMYNPISGEMMKAKIFVGSMYYLKLKHMVANKIHSRARGPIQLLTRQPTEGRAKEGGLRLGEMEKDTLLAHGASLLLKERFDSDKTVVPVCEQCGLIAINDSFKGKRYCPICGDNVEVSDIEISYAFKLILDEFKSLGLYPKLKMKDKY